MTGPSFPRSLCVFMICLFFLVSAVPASLAAEEQRLFRIGTGGLTGVYYPIGKLIAKGLTEYGQGKTVAGEGKSGVSGLVGVAQNSAGSVENVRNVVSGEIEAGLVQADVAALAFRGENVFAGDEGPRKLRAVASLYPEKFQIVTRRDADIRRFSDLRGKRISIDEKGSGTLSVMRIVLEAHGLSERDLLPVYLKPVFTHDKMVSGELQGFVMMAGVPMEAVTRVSDIGISLVPIDPEIASQIAKRSPYLVPSTIAAGAYPGIPEISTLQVFALLTVSSESPEGLVHEVTAALWSERTLSLLHEGHPQGKLITLKTALDGIPIPLHPGAERFYREQGITPKEAPMP
ncbi:TRAP transporter solute receptor, TAXI family [Syntrophobacter fumaroxidans MPOB]|uniref:TRAP transporter solute receptor, TAXI family n=2 Tax=Syntrophobacter TaxID=29526 RepID=A0LMG4_SYNFM|nr:TRAP transporter solute receptor, TAXI family [Syntrophobacter fumaroxidans MPOB]